MQEIQENQTNQIQQEETDTQRATPIINTADTSDTQDTQDVQATQTPEKNADIQSATPIINTADASNLKMANDIIDSINDMYTLVSQITYIERHQIGDTLLQMQNLKKSIGIIFNSTDDQDPNIMEILDTIEDSSAIKNNSALYAAHEELNNKDNNNGSHEKYNVYQIVGAKLLTNPMSDQEKAALEHQEKMQQIVKQIFALEKDSRNIAKKYQDSLMALEQQEKEEMKQIQEKYQGLKNSIFEEKQADTKISEIEKQIADLKRA